MTQTLWRPFEHDDAPALASLFCDAVMQFAAADYGLAARTAWAAAAHNSDAFGARLARGLTLVALQGGACAAFGQLHPASHVEMLYVAPRSARQGLAVQLLARLEDAARAAGATTLTADVSLSAARCFARAGFHLEGEERVERNGVSLMRLRMQKPLGALPVQT
ncbi:MAG TPA: GNAT family N-acetyltransferase [Paraburkholderia sp.]|nr:GNAT family N-acetyltransferase [Paraburkholderia sp.]